MSGPQAFSLPKKQRICSKKITERLFKGGNSHSMAAFPLRVVYMETERGEQEAQTLMLVTVPKRLLRHAVERNRVKRQVREAFRLNRHLLTDRLSDEPGKQVAMAFIWLANRVVSSREVTQRVANLLQRVAEKV